MICHVRLSSQCAHFTKEGSAARSYKVTPKDTCWKGVDSGWIQDPEPAFLLSQTLGGILKGTGGIPESPTLHSEPG